MVHSMAYMIKAQIQDYLIIINQIEMVREHLSKQAKDIQKKIENEAASKLNAVQKKKEDCLSQLDHAVEEQYSLLNTRTSKIDQKITELGRLLKMAEIIGESQELKQTFENVVNEPQLRESFNVNNFNITLPLDVLKDDANNQFDAMSQHGDKDEISEPETNEAKHRNDAVLPLTTIKQEDYNIKDGTSYFKHGQYEWEKQNDSAEFCDLPNFFHNMKISAEKTNPIARNGLHFRDDPCYSKSMSGTPESPMKLRESDFEKWLVKKYVKDELTSVRNADPESNRQSKRIHAHIGEAFDNICSKSLDQWLKQSTSKRDLLLDIQFPVHKKTISMQIDDILCARKWLKRPNMEDFPGETSSSKKQFAGSSLWQTDYKFDINFAQEEVKSGNFGQDDNITPTFEILKSSQLSHWLQRNRCDGSGDMHGKNETQRNEEMKMKSKINQSLEHDRAASKMKLKKWLRKDMLRKSAIQGEMRHASQTIKPNLQVWLRHSATAKTPECNFCKWLTRRNAAHCSRCNK